jgi:hypothetical protein
MEDIFVDLPSVHGAVPVFLMFPPSQLFANMHDTTLQWSTPCHLRMAVAIYILSHKN